MMKTYLKRAFQLSDSGVKGLAKSIWSFFLYYVSFVPPMICVFLFADRLLNGNTGKPVVYLLFMLAATLVMYLVINYNYKTTYDETYQESATLRIDLAEQLSKLPLSYFSKHNLSDLAQTIMADVASIEHAFANAVANSIGFAIYFLVISVALLIMNWKLAAVDPHIRRQQTAGVGDKGTVPGIVVPLRVNEETVLSLRIEDKQTVSGVIIVPDGIFVLCDEIIVSKQCAAKLLEPLGG